MYFDNFAPMQLFETHLKLSELTFLVEETLAKRFANKTIWVTAETSDIKNYPDRQYCFLSLVEKDGKNILAKMDAVIWRQQYHIINAFTKATSIPFAQNINLLLKVEVGYNSQYGLRLQIMEIDHSFTIGNLELERQSILSKLVAENPTIIKFINGEYYTYNKQIQLPKVIQRIALITAPGSDGERDFKHELSSNPYAYTFFIDDYLTQIQGRDADKAILAKLEQINTSNIAYDGVVIVRGGGSQLDFSAFDTYEIGKTIAGFKTVIITGIGHQRNVSIADMMSYTSVKTPTKAAAFIIEHNLSFEEEMLQMRQMILDTSLHIFQTAKERLNNTTSALKYAGETYLRQAKSNLNEKVIAVKHLDPENVLNRGYAMLMKDNKIIVNPDDLHTGETIKAKLKQTILTLNISDKN